MNKIKRYLSENKYKNVLYTFLCVVFRIKKRDKYLNAIRDGLNKKGYQLKNK